MPATELEKATQSQKSILLKLVQQNEAGKIWAGNYTGWKENYTYGVCYWDFIICDTLTGQDINKIRIEDSNLAGVTIPSEFGFLHELIELSLPGNQMIGSVPKEVRELSKLEVVNLRDNNFTGDIAHFTSAKMKRIDLRNNSFIGVLEQGIGSWNPLLEIYDVARNQITGPIPSTLSRCKQMTRLDLSFNDFTGTIPISLGSCTSLEYLFLNDNHIMGTIPAQLAVPGAALKELCLHGNLMTGTIPASLGDLQDLTNLYIDDNKFTGTVPKELCNRTINENFFSPTDQYVTEDDYCDSIACPPGKVSKDGKFPCIYCGAGKVSPYLNHMDNCFSTEPLSILQMLYASTNGPLWNQIEVPWTGTDYCKFTGVTCNSEDQVIGISLPSMGLQGSIPSELGFLRFLAELDLSNNELTGFLPSDLVWPPLTKLDITGNLLRGIVPPELCFEEGVNDNGKDGKYSCRNIACPVGTYSHNGRGFPLGLADVYKNMQQCEPCQSSKYLGTKTCDNNSILNTTPVQKEQESVPLPKEAIFSVFLIGFFTLSFCVYLSYLRLRDFKLKKRAGLMDTDSEWHVDDYDHEMKELKDQFDPSNPTNVHVTDDDELDNDVTETKRIILDLA